MRVEEVAQLLIILIFNYNYNFHDSRGNFLKTFNMNMNSMEKYIRESLNFNEIYYSVSKKMLFVECIFQVPPYDHYKLVSCVYGEVLDVIIDLRKSSSSYLVIKEQILIPEGASLLIPRGCAHGFASLIENSILSYNVTTPYSKEYDSGLLWDSIGYKWNINNPIISNRDKSFPKLSEFKTPFNSESSNYRCIRFSWWKYFKSI